ncbi:MAG: helix-turn-helix domain-containing protein [Patescibacteria group bacterium]|nr:helix-turn-helix domain-containing protein [Patescibacteria group bacterium]
MLNKNIMPENQVKNFKQMFEEALFLKGLNIEKLAHLADIPEDYLKAIYNEDNKKLPPAPYIRGYLMKAAEVLGIDGDVFWQAYKKNFDLKISGEKDNLPFNRFAFKKADKKKTIIVILLIFAIIYLIFGISKLFSGSLEIYSPLSDSTVVNQPFIDIKGKIDSRNRLLINNEDTPADTNGNFEKQYSLQPGINIIEFKVKKLLGKEIKITKEIIYQQ